MSRSRALLNVLNLVYDEEMPIEQAFLRDLRYSIEKDDGKSRRAPSKTYKPSSLNCIRNMWFQIMGIEVEESSATTELVGICQSGTDRHVRIQDAITSMKENGIDCEYVDIGEFIKSRGLEDRLEVKSVMGNELKLYHKELNISFLCDGIVRYKGTYFILEIKTETSTKFWSQSEIMPGHLLQGIAYSICFDIDDVMFLYENRDNCSKKTYMLHITDDMKESVVNKILECDTYVKKEKCPPKPTDVTKKDCAYCRYKEICKGVI